MKIIEALKLIKELNIKTEDLKKKISTYCADLDIETPMYPDQKRQVSEWLQAHSDIVKEISKLRFAIQKTNLATNVDVELGGQKVTKTISEWIHRRRDLAKMQFDAWAVIGDKGLKEGMLPSTTGGEPRVVKLRRYYDPVERDKMIELYRSEPGIIDRTLEITNATTDLI